MSKKIQLTIPTPCHENWDNMLPADKGKFCQSCSKEVIDFSNMSDSQLVAFFKKPTTGSVCGRFMDDQLGRQISEPKKRLPWIKYFFQFALSAFLVSSRAYTQGEVKGKIAAYQPTQITGDTILRKAIKRNSSNQLISGFVKDEKGNPVPYASAQIKGTSTGVAADSSGYFSLDIALHDSSLALVVSSVGFNEKEIPFSSLTFNQSINVVLTMSSAGEVVVTASNCFRKGRVIIGAMSTIRTYTDMFNDSLKIFQPKFTIYPNPVKPGGSITIQNKKLSAGSYTVEIIGATGQIISRQQVNAAAGSTINAIAPETTAGIYFLKLTSDKKKSFTEKIIVR